MVWVPRSALLLVVAAFADGFHSPPTFTTCPGIRHGGLVCQAEDARDQGMQQILAPSSMQTMSRRAVFLAAAGLPLVRSLPASAEGSQGLVFSKTASGLQWADAKVGTGKPLQEGAQCTIDYVMSTSGARYGSKIYSTKEVDTPYRWVIGDGKTIKGLEQAIVGGDGIPPMLPGGVRRVIIPSSLGYESLAKPLPGMQFQDCQEGRGPGPIPPELTGAGEGAYQRFKNIYCNANRPYQPDVVLDVKLYGKREA